MYLIIIYFEVKSIIMGLDYIKLGTNIKNRRKKLGYTQKRLAELIHVSEQHISHIETAHTKPSLEVIVDIANTLQTDVNNLLVDSLPAVRDEVLTSRLMDSVSGLQPDELGLVIRVAESIKDYLYPRER